PRPPTNGMPVRAGIEVTVMITPHEFVLFGESVDLCRLGVPTGGNDLLGDSVNRRQVASGTKDLGPLTRKGACDSAAECAYGTVDHCDFFLEPHLWTSLSQRLGSSTYVREARQARQFGPVPFSSRMPSLHRLGDCRRTGRRSSKGGTHHLPA